MSERIAKAWRVKTKWSDDWDTVHAETASKARYRLKCDLADCYPDLRFDQILAPHLSSILTDVTSTPNSIDVPSSAP